ncbi:putative signal transducing protein [Vibrio atypicus]|uniref:putative signal transducing protein n=1 Tax=Vibrio atypicus TaxID=558271 RepID=UPI003734CD74
MKIYSASNPPEAHIVCELLKSQSIDCEVRGEGIFGLQGEIPFGENSEPYVWLLQEQQQEKALNIIRQFQSHNIGEEWRCNHCGESNEPQFGACWQCGEFAS